MSGAMSVTLDTTPKAAAAPPLDLSYVMGELQDSLSMFADDIYALESRLTDVLLPQDDAMPTSSSDKGELSPAVVRIAEQVEHIEYLRSRVQRLIRRVNV